MDIMAPSVTAHLWAIYFLLAIMVINILTILNQKSFVTLAKRLKFFTPIFHTLNAAIIYSGTIYAAYYHIFNFKVILMIFASIFVMVLEIKRYKKLRVIKSTDTHLQEEFKLYAKKIYAIEIAIIIIVYIVSIVIL
ncbi:MAG: hypothetical protein GX118_05205 [Arcobacter butzleri]|jgi:hypothetical protein|nr:hypothetical protein [Arcobacteraceae bacterium]MDY0364278.1 hypothetical protein [Arcobacteraceae bacterium]NLO17570.1 hypothetical protein [Aliarcobacter butzleri]